MTTFEKPVTRVTAAAYSVLYAGRRKARPIVVRLALMGGDDMIEFREKGTRQRWLLPVDTAFRAAIQRAAFTARMAKAQAKPRR